MVHTGDAASEMQILFHTHSHSSEEKATRIQIIQETSQFILTILSNDSLAVAIAEPRHAEFLAGKCR